MVVGAVLLETVEWRGGRCGWSWWRWRIGAGGGVYVAGGTVYFLKDTVTGNMADGASEISAVPEVAVVRADLVGLEERVAMVEMVAPVGMEPLRI